VLDPLRRLRVVSWNLAHRVKRGAKQEADLLRELEPDFALLQEANANSIGFLADEAGFDWVRWTTSDSQPQRSGSGYLAAVAGRGKEPEWLSPRFEVPFPDRVTAVRVRVGNAALIAASYHAPPGVSWGPEKAQQAVTFARWLADQNEQCVLGADANTPEVDHPDFAFTRTHWRTGVRGLKGKPGDDLLWGPTKVHGLQDAFRVALANDPARLQAIRDLNPAGPLAVSYRTRRRMGKPSTPWRFDGIWVTSGLGVVSVNYLYEQGIQAGSDHAIVVADLELSAARDALA
jgi:exonuclease III